MARELEEFPTEVLRTGYTKYPWDEWANGKPWELVAGEDYYGKMGNFVTQARRTARAKGMELHWARTSDKVLVLQFRKQ